MERGEIENSVMDKGGSVFDCCDVEGECCVGIICAGRWG